MKAPLRRGFPLPDRLRWRSRSEKDDPAQDQSGQVLIATATA
jgi:hypothetical protein